MKCLRVVPLCVVVCGASIAGAQAIDRADSANDRGRGYVSPRPTYELDRIERDADGRTFDRVLADRDRAERAQAAQVPGDVDAAMPVDPLKPFEHDPLSRPLQALPTTRPTAETPPPTTRPSRPADTSTVPGQSPAPTLESLAAEYDREIRLLMKQRDQALLSVPRDSTPEAEQRRREIHGHFDRQREALSLRISEARWSVLGLGTPSTQPAPATRTSE